MLGGGGARSHGSQQCYTSAQAQATPDASLGPQRSFLSQTQWTVGVIKHGGSCSAQVHWR